MFHSVEKSYPKQYEKTGDLVRKSRFVSALCQNEPIEDPILCYSHHLPLLDPKIGWLTPDNWDLPEKEKKKVLAHTEALKDYALAMVELCRTSKSHIFDLEKLKGHTLLPQWIVFPLYSRTSLGWRMGIGEAYLALYHRFSMERAKEEGRERYLKELETNYPMPAYFKSRWLEEGRFAS